MLQTVCMSPDLLLSQNINENEICAYSPGHESPLPGETASPPNHFQQSPSLPDSGLTERNVASPETYRLPSAKPQEMSAPTDSGLSSEPPQKRYMGVRVKMPVRELLRKIRLSKGLDPGHSKEATLTKTAAKGSSGKTAEKRRAHPYTEKQLRQSKQSIGQTPKGLEDLDILVEVLQEDLNTSQSKAASPSSAPESFCQSSSSTELQATQREPGTNRQAARGLQERCHSVTKLRSRCPFKDCNRLLQGELETPFHSHKHVQEPDSSGSFSRASEKQSSWWMQDVCTSSQRDVLRLSAWSTSPCYQAGCPEEFVEANTGSPEFGGHLKSFPLSSTEQDLSAISFFQFQLHREESLLRNISSDKLLAPDENGNRSPIFLLKSYGLLFTRVTHPEDLL